MRPTLQRILFGSAPTTTLDLRGAVVAFYDAIVASSVILDGSTSLEWRDLSVNARHLAQPTKASQLTYTNINGRPALSSDGVNDWMNTGSFVLPQPFSRFCVLTPRNASAGDHVLNSRLGSPNTALFRSNDTNISAFAGSILSSTRQFLNGQTAQIGELFNGSTSTIINNGFLTTGNSGTSGIDGLNIGSFDGISRLSQNDYHSVAIFNRLLTTEERLKLEVYFARRWNVPESISTNPWARYRINLLIN